MYWGITDLEKAKLLEYGEKKGTYRITDAGRTYFSDYPGPITAKGLYENCTAFKKWKDGYQAASKAKNASEPEGVSTLEDQESPQEAMESAYGETRDALADDLISIIMGKRSVFLRAPGRKAARGDGLRREPGLPCRRHQKRVVTRG